MIDVIKGREKEGKFDVLHHWSSDKRQRKDIRSISRDVYSNDNIFFVSRTVNNKIVGGYSTV